ncbi:hypothetical protein [Rubrolithibacter danxiaensis]|uniref:hypothetical protein n=1 Tax=Rubrolithibacter danxiaensis TaxID=3390805 RepID=UPI003BF87752
MKLFNKLHGGSEGSGHDGSLITAKVFLGKEDGTNYFTAKGFVEYAKSLREHEVEQLEQFFEFVKNGHRIVGTLITRKDKAGRPYQHPPFHMAKSSQGVKVITEGGMAVFIKDYQEGRITINFTLEELIEEALN